MQPHKLTDDLDDLINEVRLEIPEAGEPVIEHFLRRAIVLFCEESHYWQEDLGPILVMDGIDSYIIPTNRYQAPVSVMSVSYINGSGDSVMLEASQDECVSPRYWQDTPFSIQIAPLADLQGVSLSIVTAVKPRVYRDEFKFSENLTIQYRDAIVAGAKGLIYKMPRKEWSDPQQAGININMFNDAARAARRHQAQGYSREPRSVNKPRSFY